VTSGEAREAELQAVIRRIFGIRGKSVSKFQRQGFSTTASSTKMLPSDSENDGSWKQQDWRLAPKNGYIAILVVGRCRSCL